MKKHPKLASTVAFLGFMLAMSWPVSASWAAAENYPTRTIQIIIGYSPGSTDMGLKPFVDKMPELLGQPMSFVYKPGGAGAVGASFVAKAKPDGYTLLGTTQGSVVLAPLTKEGLDYTLDDFMPICRVSLTPLGLAVKADSPWKTLKDVVEAAQKSPGKVNYSTSGTYGSTHFAMEIFAKSARIRMTHVPTSGSAPAVTALLGGHVKMACSSMGPLMPHVNSGALRILAFMQRERLKNFPDTPTFSEQGYAVVFPAWYGLLGPKGISKEVVEKIYSASRKVVEQHKKFIDDRLRQSGFELFLMGPEEMARECRAESEIVSRIFKDLVAKPKK